MMAKHPDGEHETKDEEEQIADDLKIIEWPDLENALAQLCSVVFVKNKVQAKKEGLAKRVEAAVEMRRASLQRIDELEALHRKLGCRAEDLEDSKTVFLQRSEALTGMKDRLLPSARSLLLAANSLAAAQSRLQEADRLLAGEGGYGRLMQLLKMLAVRRRLMVTQVASLYPLAPCATTVMQEKHSADARSQPSFGQISEESQHPVEIAVKKLDTLPMTIGGLHVVAPLNKKPGLYNGKNDTASATALGYVAHVISLIASYLGVPLRYPVRLGASHSYIQDYAPSTESNNVETSMHTAGTSQMASRKNVIEFPLFSEGQDATRSAYAVFLLNKDLEQMLNYLGAESVGPRHTLPNLNRLIQLVCSGVHNNV